jgi:hypothetical protein
VVSGSHPRILVTWKNSLNEIIGTGLSISNLSSGIYCYEIRDDCCLISDCIEVGTCTLSATATPMHPSAPGLSNGSISIQVLNAVDPVSYIWSTGSTDNPIQNLPIGTYTVTVSDLYHCSAVKTVTLINCPSISVTSNASVVNPSACNTNDGRIRFLSGPFVAGGVGPYTFQWKDENNNILSNSASQLSNLVPGNYFIVATDVNGCTGSQEFNLIPNYYPNLEVSITNPCSGVNNGKIDLVAYSNLGGTYNFEWDNGLSDIETNTSINDNLNQGTYCVDITSNEDGCVFTKCYDLISQVPPSEFSVTSTFLVPCPRSYNGNISLTLTGGLAPYTFDWSDLNDFGEPEDRYNLGSGIYTVTVSDFCGSTIVRTFDLTDISSNFTITQTIGCKPDVKGSATAVVTGGTPAYTYKWNISGTYYSQPTVNNLSPGTYSVTVTDSRGCTVSRTFVQKTRLFYTEITSACDGMNSGEILFKVFNPPPSSSYVKIEGDGIVLYENFNSGEEITFKMTNLLAGFSVIPKVTIGDCVINGTSPVIVTEKNKELRYVSYESGQCKFQEYCEGTLLAPNEYLYSDPTYEIPTGGSAISCFLDVKCGGIKVDEKHIKTEKMRYAQYKALLNFASNFGIYPENQIDYPPCTNVKVCPVNMQIVSAYSIGGVNGTLYQSETPGCYNLRCGIFSLINSSFCVNDVLATFANEWGNLTNIPDLSGCEVIRQNLYQLIVWESQLISAFPDFEGSELYLLIQAHKGDRRVGCADVYFCKDDFKVLSAPNFLDLVSCNDYPDWTHVVLNNGSSITEPVDCSEVGNEDGGVINNQGCNVIYCLDPDGSTVILDESPYTTHPVVYGEYVYICPTFDGSFLMDEHHESRNLTKSGSIHSKEVIIYPNPNDGVFEVLIRPENVGVLTLEAFNIIGTKVFRESIYVDETLEATQKIDLKNCPSGIFFLNITDSKGNSFVKKVIKQ